LRSIKRKIGQPDVVAILQIDRVDVRHLPSVSYWGGISAVTNVGSCGFAVLVDGPFRPVATCLAVIFDNINLITGRRRGRAWWWGWSLGTLFLNETRVAVLAIVWRATHKNPDIRVRRAAVVKGEVEAQATGVA
jgi:hypothetical protein